LNNVYYAIGRIHMMRPLKHEEGEALLQTVFGRLNVQSQENV